MIATTKDIERIVAHSLSNPIHSISSSLHNAKDFNKVVAWLKQSVHSNWESDRPYSLQLAKILYYLLHENQSKETNKMISDSTLESIAAKLVNPEIFFDVTQLTEFEAHSVTAYLKKCVDGYRWRDDRQAVTYAQAIISLGKGRENLNITALGLMALGDSLSVTTDRLKDAWSYHEKAGACYLEEGNILGWARTRIGQLAICIELGQIEIAVKNAELAQDIFHSYDENDLFVRLVINLLWVYNEQGEYQKSLAISDKAVAVAIALGSSGQQHLSLLYINIGNAYLYSGNFHKALESYKLAQPILQSLKNDKALAIVSLNIAYVQQSLGHYHLAIHQLNEVLKTYEGLESIRAIRVKIDMVECHLHLNRVQEALAFSKEIITELGRLQATYPNDMAHILRFQALAEARLQQYQNAKNKLQQASDYYALLNSETWVTYVRLLMGRISFLQGEYQEAKHIASECSLYFFRHNQQVNFLRSLLLKASSLFALGEISEALTTAKEGWQLTRKLNTLRFHYDLHLLLGKIEEQRQQIQRAKRHYSAAVATVRRLQENLTITIRPDFLEDKDEAIHALIRLALKEGNGVKVFETLEVAKSMTFMGYLANRERLFWLRGDQASDALVDKLERLREEHHVLYRQANEVISLKENEPNLDQTAVSQNLKQCEREIRAITEQLYLRSAFKNKYRPTKIVTLTKIQKFIPADSVMLAYYYHQEEMWGLAVTNKNIEIVPLPASVSKLKKVVEKLQFNIKCAIEAGLESQTTQNLTRIFDRLSRKLFDALLAPTLPYLHGQKRLLLVPYGILHYVPFNLLHNGRHYLIEEMEIVTYPSSSLLTRKKIHRSKGAVVLAHTHQGLLPYTKKEAAVVSQIFPTEHFIDDSATIRHLARQPKQILHLAAHGNHRVDVPELSYIQLADGQLMADDLLQQDLSYELVTLSACETGQLAITRSGELIGLGRGVMAAGAGALVSSLWRVDDRKTLDQMEIFYKSLCAGASKASALKDAQCQLFYAEPNLHPAYWGAFQLMGDARPLSGYAS